MIKTSLGHERVQIMCIAETMPGLRTLMTGKVRPREICASQVWTEHHNDITTTVRQQHNNLFFSW